MPIDAYAQANQEFVCTHEQVALRRRTVLAKGKEVLHVYRQCMRCGHNGGAVAKHPLSSLALSELEAYDEELPARWRERWSARLKELQAQAQEEREREQQEQSEEWWAWYESYLLTPQWSQLRAAVLARDKGICQGCLGRCGLPATQAHHLTYEHVGAEFAWELVAVCIRCHERLHGRGMSISMPTDRDRVPDCRTVQDVEAALRREAGAANLDEVPF